MPVSSSVRLFRAGLVVSFSFDAACPSEIEHSRHEPYRRAVRPPSTAQKVEQSRRAAMNRSCPRCRAGRPGDFREIPQVVNVVSWTRLAANRKRDLPILNDNRMVPLGNPRPRHHSTFLQRQGLPGSLRYRVRAVPYLSGWAQMQRRSASVLQTFERPRTEAGLVGHRWGGVFRVGGDATPRLGEI